MRSSRSTRGTASAPALPSGTLTFLFSDIEGSTSRWETSPQQMSAALEEHDLILQAAIARHRGYVFKKMGDAICAAFQRASDAATAAIETQRELDKADFGATGPLAVRIALHTGEAEERDGDYLGPALNRVARLLGIGYGRQVLMSSTTASLVRADRSRSFDTLALGRYRLRDLPDAEEVFQLGAPGLPSQFPRLRSLDAAPNNLPVQLTSFVGREEEVRTLAGSLARAHLLTLVGPGGVGKTRLALEIGARCLADYADGVWIADLGSIGEAELLESVVASTLGVRSTVGPAEGVSLARALSSKHLLLILDNCEHMIDAVAKLIEQILQSSADLRCIATSREAFRISGEHVHHVDALAVPEGREPLPPLEARQFAAVDLFCERAQQAVERFTLTDHNLALVTEVCRRLDGLPLAIELSAAQLRVLSLEHLNSRLKERLPLVAGANRAALPRHLTIESLIGWSYGLLPETQARLFRRLEIFSGTFSLEAADEVCRADGTEAQDTLGLLSRLVDQSLVFVDMGRGTERYRLLETTRQFALAKMRELGEHESVAERSAAYFRRLVRETDEAFHTTPHGVWFNRLNVDLDNVRGVLSWAFSDGNAAWGAEIVGRLDRFWFEAGLINEAGRWIERALSLIDISSHADIVARLWLARALFLAGEQKLKAAERSRDLYEAAGDDRGLAYALRELGVAYRQIGRSEQARAAMERASALLEEAGDAGGLALTLNSLGALHAYGNQFEQAQEIYSKALAVAREQGAEYAIMMAYLHLADLQFLSADAESAIAYALEAQKFAENTLNSRFFANVKYNLAAYRIAANQLDSATADARDALLILRQNQDSFQIANVVLHLAYLAAAAGDGERAAKLIGYSDNYLKVHGMEREPTENWVRERAIDVLRGQPAEKRLAALLELGGAMTEEQAIKEGLGLGAPDFPSNGSEGS